MILALGFVFELPLLISFPRPRWNRHDEAALCNRRSAWAIVALAFVLAHFVRQDPESQAKWRSPGPSSGLYFLSILLSMFVFKPRKKKDEPTAE